MPTIQQPLLSNGSANKHVSMAIIEEIFLRDPCRGVPQLAVAVRGEKVGHRRLELQSESVSQSVSKTNSGQFLHKVTKVSHT
jgi:hypothetical protein